MWTLYINRNVRFITIVSDAIRCGTLVGTTIRYSERHGIRDRYKYAVVTNCYYEDTGEEWHTDGPAYIRPDNILENYVDTT